VEGNWAVSVCIPLIGVIEGPFVNTIMEKINERESLRSYQFEVEPADNTHISLSRTCVLQYHNIDPFVTKVKDCLLKIKCFDLTLHGVEFFLNDELTRSFIGVLVEEGLDLVSEGARFEYERKIHS
jgi:hypothetical protein